MENQEMYVQQPVKKTSGLGTAALVLGIIAIVLSFIPIIRVIVYVLGPLALIFGLISWIQKRGIGISAAGAIMGAVAIILTIVLQIATVAAVDHAVKKTFGEDETSYTTEENTSSKEKSEENSSSNEENSLDNENKSSPKKQSFAIGDKIVTDKMEITINDVGLSYDVLPDDLSGYYTHYAADSGKVYVVIDADVYNKSKQSLDFDEVGSAKADYNGGFEYAGFIAVKDSSSGFTYAILSDIEPLETKGMKWLIECPEEVETSDNPLSVILRIDGKTYEHTIR